MTYVIGWQAHHMSFCKAVIHLVQKFFKFFFQRCTACSTYMDLVMGVENISEIKKNRRVWGYRHWRKTMSGDSNTSSCRSSCSEKRKSSRNTCSCLVLKHDYTIKLGHEDKALIVIHGLPQPWHQVWNCEDGVLAKYCEPQRVLWSRTSSLQNFCCW